MPLWSNFPEPRTYAENLINVTKGCLRWCKCLTSDLCQCFGQCANGESCWFAAYLILALEKLYWFIPQGVSRTPQHHKSWALREKWWNTDLLSSISSGIWTEAGILSKYGKIRIQFSPYTGKYGLEKARIWAYFTQRSSL